MSRKGGNYYAVAKGRNAGVYNSWDECKAQTAGYSGSQFKKFSSESDAMNFVSEPTSAHGYSQKTSTRGAEVYTDGACEYNGGSGAKGGIGVYWGPGNSKNVSEPLKGRQTNNRAEIRAAMRAVSQAKENGLPDLTIKTDSEFLVKSQTKWMDNWQRNDWKTASGGPVKNRADFEELNDVSRGINVTYKHVPGHAGNPGNEAADRLAREAIRKRY
uniref:ribonuclease H n=1 Tax=Strigamia maritima TaxID=126957 RepID=T1JJN0_STRMM